MISEQPAFEQSGTSVSCFVDRFTARTRETVVTMTIRDATGGCGEVIVVQLRLLDLMVRSVRDPVSMDVADSTRRSD